MQCITIQVNVGWLRLDAMEQRQGLEMLSIAGTNSIREKPKPIISDDILPAPERSKKINVVCRLNGVFFAIV